MQSFIDFFSGISLPIQIHLLAVFAAIALLAPLAVMKKGTSRHKVFGRFWVFAMVVTSLSSFWIHEIRTFGNFSPIHLISVFTLGSLAWGVFAVRRRNVHAHVSAMVGTAIGGLGIAGVLSIGSPGRLLSTYLFGT